MVRLRERLAFESSTEVTDSASKDKSEPSSPDQPKEETVPTMDKEGATDTAEAAPNE